ncbi:MAG: PadR family transcriptional regulator [Firmicutes bacterium]|nr:PadR family transcriptional regulator [Bacillota bacterium]
MAGSASMMVLGLIYREDMYGYQITEQLKNKSDDAFNIKAGTLYPILHSLEKDGFVTSYEKVFNGKLRKYYSITEEGVKEYDKKKSEWTDFFNAVKKVLD